MKKYIVLKSTNLTENNFSLSLTRGEVRDDLENRFTAPYLKWHCDEKFLSVQTDKLIEDESEKFVPTPPTKLIDGENEKFVPTPPTKLIDGENDDNLDDLPKELDTANSIENPDGTDLEDDETLTDLGSENPDLVDETEDFPDFDSMSIAEVKTYAKDNNVDIVGLKKKSDIIDAIFDELSDTEEV